MSNICSIGLGIPKYELSQQKVKKLVENLFPVPVEEMTKLLSVFDNAAITKRQFVVNEHWLQSNHTFAEKNNLYKQLAKTYSLLAIDDCLTNDSFLDEPVPYEAVDMIIFISSTGIATPALDTYIMNERPFKKTISRMPLWGLGCAGGAIGLARANDWVMAHPDKVVLIVCCELCSLTFQKDDMKKSNLVGTALFGDGISAALIIGDHSPYLQKAKNDRAKICRSSTYTEKNSISVMGWEITDRGFEVIFSKSIPELVKSLWKNHLTSFLQTNCIDIDNLHSMIAHPGGVKVLQAMEAASSIPKQKLIHSYNVLQNHGNMSSATVLYVLQQWMKEKVEKQEKSILSALGPGFTSELLLLEWT